MIRLGLTGSMATGKSTVANMFRDQNVPIYDADKAVHELYKGEAVGPVGELFPDAIINGQVDRKALSAIVLNDKTKLASLEKVVHPLVHQKMHQFIEDHKKAGADLVILEIPLLFETGKTYPLDKIVVTYCADDIQFQRAMGRPGMTKEKFEAIKARQMPQSEKRERADFAIDTGTTMDQTRQAVDDVIASCRALANQ